MRQILTERIFESSLDCTYKCHLLANGRHGNKTEYEEHTERSDRMYQRAAIARLQDATPETKTLYLTNVTPHALDSNAQLVIIKRVEANGLQSDSIVLSRGKTGRVSYEPVYFDRYDNISLRGKLVLAFRAMLIEKAAGIAVSHGQIIYEQNFTRVTILLSTLIAEVARMICRLHELATQKNPPLFLCSHCEICEFASSCRSRAVTEDSISLIQGVRRPHIEEQNRKGIFTLHQYSHTFRPRRLPKRVKNPSKPRYFALQARALQDDKVYIYGSPSYPVAETSIYFDIEGLPGRHLYYLFGMLVVTGTVESYQSFWVNDRSEQTDIFLKFCEAVAAYPNAALFHFGNYDVKAVKSLKRGLGDEYGRLIERLLNSSHNILSVLHHHYYFPLYSNRLKDVASFLRYEFNNEVRSGVGSIVCRERWEETADHGLKEALIKYNRQDCEALKTVCDFVLRSAASTSGGTIARGNTEVVPAESLRQVGEGNRPVFRKAEFQCPEFELVNRCAYFDYQRDRVSFRNQLLPISSRPHRAKNVKRRMSLATEVTELPDRCPPCGSKKLL
jgi:predicted RecB family nuclease